MDAGSSAPSRPLPKTSRLPVLTTKSSQIPVSRQHDQVPPPKEPAPRPTLEKRQSIATLPRSTASILKATVASSKPSIGKPGASTTSRQAQRTSATTRAPTVRPSSRGNQQRLPPRPPRDQSVDGNEENADQLSSLDSFRSASRQGWNDESPIEQQEALAFDGVATAPKSRKASRPSLSDRTMESLQNLPVTPKERRQSDFFSPSGNMGPPPRPSSSMSRNVSRNGSRPGTSDGSLGAPPPLEASMTKRALSSAKPATRRSLGGFGFTPGRSISTSSSFGKPPASSATAAVSRRSPSPSKPPMPTPGATPSKGLKLPSKSKTVAARPSKPKPSLQDAFAPLATAGAEADKVPTKPKPKLQGTLSESQGSASPKAATATASSNALRQQIAAAKAAARKEKAKADAANGILATNSSVDSAIDMHYDPFNQAPRDEKHIIRNRINAARMDGRLNIAAMGLKQIPDEVMKMYDSAAMEASNVSWAEVVDLTRLMAADNDFDDLGEDIFPDKSAEDFEADDQTSGNQFGGLESLDLHGNKIRAAPLGLRRLERLTSLNLSHNKLENDALDVISQISSLKDLKLGHNNLSGNLPTALCSLKHLETLDVQSNRLLGLPEALRELVSLRVLNVCGNQLTALPIEALYDLPLVDLDASNNALIASLFPPGANSSHTTIRSLKVANNSLAALTFAEALDLPSLRSLDVTNNHLTGLPDMSGWTELITLMAGDNKVTELPSGFTKLGKLKNVNFTSNELRLLDPEIARMPSLESLVLASNPLRERRFLNISTADLKRDLRARIEPEVIEDAEGGEQDDFQDARDSFSSSVSSPKQTWALQANGKLEISSKGYTDSINDNLGSFLQERDVKQLYIGSNKLTAIPPALWLGHDLKTLDLSGNTFSSDYLYDELCLPNLQELNMTRCNLVTFEPLMTHLQAEKLQTLNVAINRLTNAVPNLRHTYPALATLIAQDNKFTSVTADTLRGLQIVNLSGNDIEQLPAEIGLLWNEGLRSLEVGRNAFRVPNHRILDKGTEATMKYLRDRLPEGQRE
ncbi:uncharacterized protein LTR77_005587 [Saxophila tyrrhenica]|uniref:L domain-like protein n=1 Tax=Saxophila tyrrhenica TaxID=1690608 RepID=A0AAV9PD19_9PEZI|nr:hypothetical protein LTR77_005587 [Saxophila tyrrhenica]